MAKPVRVLHWFRTDLRLHDSPSLKAALDLKPECFYPLWCWDPHYVFSQRVGPNRWQFLLDSMQDLSKSISKVNPKSKLFVVRGPPATMLPALFKQWGITDIVWEKDDDPYTTARDAMVSDLAKSAGVKVHIVLGHTLYDSALILSKNKGASPRSYGPFLKFLDKLPKPAKPLPAPTELPDPGILTLEGFTRTNHSVLEFKNEDNNAPSRLPPTTDAEISYEGENFNGPLGDFAIPTLEELGMVATTTIRGGETRALEVFEEFMKDKNRVATFEKPKTAPGEFDPPSTTQLSPHLKFGTLSCRTFYHRVLEINSAHKSPSTPPESLIGQLLWREFFHSNAQLKDYNQIRGNNLSRYIDWDLQSRFDKEGKMLPKEEMVKIWKAEEPEAYERLMAWKEGRTGFPWIDALMRQLKQEGWMHHLGRHSTACMLTRGQLYISWERGMEVYEELLVDHDSAVNGGNWMWLSCSAFFAQYFRVYSPATYGQNTEKTGKLIRKYCPELKGYSDKLIYTPWLATVAVQKAAGCVIGVDYPKRIVDDKVTKDQNIKKLKAAYAAKMYGDNPKVLNGTADAHIATFFVPAAVKEENVGAKDHDDEDGEEDIKPVKGKRAAAPKKEKAEKGPKQAKLAFKTE